MSTATTSYPVPCRPGRARRGAALYVMALGLSMIVSAIGLSAVMVARAQLRMNMAEQDLREARRLASSAVETALVVLNTNPNWRTDYQHNVEYPSTPFQLGDGTFTWKLVDQDGSLDDNDADAVRVYGIGRLGQQISTASVQVQPSGSPLTCLEVSAHAGNDVVFNGVQVTGNQIISANNSINASSSNIDPAVEAANAVNGGTFNGGSTSGITPRTMPDPNSVFDYYIANGTHIAYDSLDSDTGGTRQLNRRVLSPATNPYGTSETNSSGIYVIDCGGNRIRGQFSRIVGTLVLLNVGSDSVFFNSFFAEPAVPNHPTLLVQGNFRLQFDSADPLDESWVGRNFNPPGTPYEGQEDVDQVDTYPSMVKGLVYVSGDLVTNSPGSLAFDGVWVIGNTFDCRDATDLQYDSTFFNNPPPGFRSGDVLEVMRGSWRPGPGN